MDGAADTPDEQVKQRALALAKERGLNVSKLKTLHVDPTQFQRGSQYSVDPKKQVLVRTETSKE